MQLKSFAFCKAKNPFRRISLFMGSCRQIASREGFIFSSNNYNLQKIIVSNELLYFYCVPAKILAATENGRAKFYYKWKTQMLNVTWQKTKQRRKPQFNRK